MCALLGLEWCSDFTSMSSESQDRVSFNEETSKKNFKELVIKYIAIWHIAMYLITSSLIGVWRRMCFFKQSWERVFQWLLSWLLHKSRERLSLTKLSSK